MDLLPNFFPLAQWLEDGHIISHALLLHATCFYSIYLYLISFLWHLVSLDLNACNVTPREGTNPRSLFLHIFNFIKYLSLIMEDIFQFWNTLHGYLLFDPLLSLSEVDGVRVLYYIGLSHVCLFIYVRSNYKYLSWWIDYYGLKGFRLGLIVMQSLSILLKVKMSNVTKDHY